MKIPNPKTSEEWEAAFAAGPQAKWPEYRPLMIRMKKAQWQLTQERFDGTNHPNRWALMLYGKKKKEVCVFGPLTGDDIVAPKKAKKRMQVRAEVFIAHHWKGK